MLSTEPLAPAALSPFGARVDAAPGQALTDLDPRALDALALREKLVLLRGFPAPDRDAFLAWCRSFPERRPLEWESGPVMEMRETPGARNYLFSREAVPFHWDGAFHRVPRYLMFHCVAAPRPGAGGETLFCDTAKVWEKAEPARRALWNGLELSFETRKLAHYGGAVRGPLVARHPETGATVLRFAEPVETALNPVSLRVHGAQPEHFLADMRRRVYDPAFCLRHEWRAGDVLIADNDALIHARTAFAKDEPRHLRRIQLI